jgi:hypothetical protein
MFKILILLFLSLTNVIGLSPACFTSQDVKNTGLVSYKNKVYDIENYEHPAGKRTLLLSKGKPLEEFFDLPEYNFHQNSISTNKDLENIYIGELKIICNNTNNYTNNYTNNNNFIYNDTTFQYLIITLFFILLMSLSLIITKYSKNNYFSNSLYIYILGYISIDIILFYVMYIIWWNTLLVLSFVLEDTLTRLGIWITINIAFILLPVTRNSIFITSLKIPYNKLITFHKLISILSLTSVIIKFTTIMCLNNIKFLFNDLSATMGTVCSLSILITSILSFPYIRRNVFELFYYSHKFLFFVTIISMSFHYIICLYIILPSVILYFYDLILRILNTSTAIYTKIKNVEFKDTAYIFVTLKVPKPINTKPGCYFFLCCKEVSQLEWHPISLLSTSQNTLVFCVKNPGDKTWGDTLKKLQNNKLLYENFKVCLQGPYNHITLDYNTNKYEYIINIANGVGITPFISILNDINNLYIKNKLNKLKKVVFIWIIPDLEYATPFIEYFGQFYKNIDINIFISKIPTIPNINIEEKYADLCTITYIKPNIIDYIRKFLLINNIQDRKNTCIISCGSSGLINDIYKTSSMYKIKLFNESFN